MRTLIKTWRNLDKPAFFIDLLVFVLLFATWWASMIVFQPTQEETHYEQSR